MQDSLDISNSRSSVDFHFSTPETPGSVHNFDVTSSDIIIGSPFNKHYQELEKLGNRLGNTESSPVAKEYHESNDEEVINNQILYQQIFNCNKCETFTSTESIAKNHVNTYTACQQNKTAMEDQRTSSYETPIEFDGN